MSLANSARDIWKFDQTMHNYGWSTPNDCIWNVIGENHNNIVVTIQGNDMKAWMKAAVTIRPIANVEEFIFDRIWQ